MRSGDISRIVEGEGARSTFGFPWQTAHCVWKTAIPFSVPGTPRWPPPAACAAGACCAGWGACECAAPTHAVTPMKNTRAMSKMECLLIDELLGWNLYYGSAYTYNDSFLVGSGSVMPPPPDAVIATYCFPFLA